MKKIDKIEERTDVLNNKIKVMVFSIIVVCAFIFLVFSNFQSKLDQATESCTAQTEQLTKDTGMIEVEVCEDIELCTIKSVPIEDTEEVCVEWKGKKTDYLNITYFPVGTYPDGIAFKIFEVTEFPAELIIPIHFKEGGTTYLDSYPIGGEFFEISDCSRTERRLI